MMLNIVLAVCIVGIVAINIKALMRHYRNRKVTK